MRVLMVNHPRAQVFRGGDLVQMRQSAQELRKLGVEVGESFDPQPDAANYDVAHVFNLRTVGATWRQVVALKAAGLPIVLSPIYLDPGQALWATRAMRNIFGNPAHAPEKIVALLGQLARRRLAIKTKQGVPVAAGLPNRPMPRYDDVQRRILEAVDHLLPNSTMEVSALFRTLRVCGLEFTIVPYAAEAREFLDADPEPFVRKSGLRNFVLCAGRQEWSKNQLLLARALQREDVPLVFIGGCMQPGYRELIQKHASKRTTIIDHLPPGELRHAYAAAAVHALPSWIETCGLVHLEAALADCSIVASTAGYEVEYLRDGADYCDPADADSIRRAVLRSLANRPREAGRRAALRDRILSEYTWENAAKATLTGYRRALGERN